MGAWCRHSPKRLTTLLFGPLNASIADDESQAAADAAWNTRAPTDLEAVREAAIHAALCLSGFIGEGIDVDGVEPPEDVWCRIVTALGVPEADDDDLRALLAQIRSMPIDIKGEKG